MSPRTSLKRPAAEGKTPGTVPHADHADRIPVLDGLRGIAVTWVIVFHCAVNGPLHVANALPWLAGFGWSGVDLFFVLSGFLITRILLDTRADGGYFKKFYARRVLRIFPLFYLYLLGYWLLHGGLGDSPLLQLTHLSNWYVQQLGNWGVNTPANLTWSLSIEEQYYLAWPLIVYALSDKKLLLVCWAMIVGALLVRISYLAPDVPKISIYVSTLARIDTFAMGALVALAMRTEGGWRRLKWAPWPFLAAGLGLGVTLIVLQQAVFFSRMTPAALAIFLSCVAAFYASSMALIVRHADQPVLRGVFASPVLRKLGKHSYAMYLLHIEIILGCRWLFESGPLQFFSGINASLAALAFTVLAAALTLGASIIVWHLFEKRFLALKSRFEYAS